YGSDIALDDRLSRMRRWLPTAVCLALLVMIGSIRFPQSAAIYEIYLPSISESLPLSPTPAPPGSVSPTPTPISLGANVASLGCTSAYMVQGGILKALDSESDPALAIDGDLGTEWNAGIAPSPGTQVLWQWS